MSTHASISPQKKSIRFYLQHPLTASLILCLLCFFVYNANLRQIGSGDTLPARYQPLILWRDGTLNFDANAHLVANGHPVMASRNRPAGANGKITYLESWSYWMTRTREHQIASVYPVVATLLVAPLYIPAIIWLNSHHWAQPQVEHVAIFMEKFSASLLASLASVFLYLVLRHQNTRWSFPLALAFAFGTNTWMISSQALWQHGAGELFIALGLFLVILPASAARTALLGAVCVLMTANRPPDGLVAAAMVFFVVWSRRRNALWLLVGAALPLAGILYYNLSFIGHIAGGYGLLKPSENFFQKDWLGVAGLLVSPTRGLLIFSPFLVFVPIGLIQRLRSPESRGLAVALSFAVVAQILLYSQGDWRAGTAWGPRWLTDILPILMWMLAPAPLLLRPLARGLLIVLMVMSIGVQMIGAFWYTKTSDELIFAGNPTSMSSAWDIQNIPFLTELRHAPASGELHCNTDGSIDRVGSDPKKLPTLETGTLLEGWALTCGETPAKVLLLIDGIVVGSTTDFKIRGDVNRVMHSTSPSGWRISAKMLGVASGERILQLAVRIHPRSDIRIVREQPVFVIAQGPATQIPLPQNQVTDAALDAMAKRAALLLRKHQSEPGFWLTMHTKSLLYEAPKQEMNTFLTSMLVDFLSPIAHQQGLEDVLARARQHLTAQIESNGLVRYHGLPNGPTIGKLGCVITPDADDTALVWEIYDKGATDPRLQPMLAELARYRDARGLYRTWLAPQAQYRCIDPGSDPNPTDIGIQMNVYLMLRELDLPAAQHLCAALKRSFWDGDLWIYYSKAPIIPYLRSVELRKLGCEIPRPIEKLALPAAGQELWSEAAYLLADTIESAPNDKTRQAIRSLLIRMGRNNFMQIRNAPPLLYNNDASATVRRFYWSDDFGYAIWLRLYEATKIETRNAPPPVP